jgi:hypothetical protein
MGDKEETEEQYRYRVRKLRHKITLWVLAIMGVFWIVMLVLSQPFIQEAFFPLWLIARWKIVVYIAIFLAVPTICFLPVVLEANFYPRVLVPPTRGGSRHTSWYY